jgi:hypothetical protein
MLNHQSFKKSSPRRGSRGSNISASHSTNSLGPNEGSEIGRTASVMSEIKASIHGESFCRFHPLPDREMIVNKVSSSRRKTSSDSDESAVPIKTLKDFDPDLRTGAEGSNAWTDSEQSRNRSRISATPTHLSTEVISDKKASSFSDVTPTQKKTCCCSWLFSRSSKQAL